MRQTIPKKICDMQDKCAPYLHYVKDKGVVLDSDAPSEIVDLKNEVDKWFEQHQRD